MKKRLRGLSRALLPALLAVFLILVVVLVPIGTSVQATSGFLSIGIERNAVGAQEEPPSLNTISISDIPAYGVVEPSGCGEFKGRVKVRIDMFMSSDAPYYDKYHVQVVDETSEEYQNGYPGEVDPETGEPLDWDDYQKWMDSLPTVWVNTPFHSHMVYFDTKVTDEEIKAKVVKVTEYFYAFHLHCWDEGLEFIGEWKKVPIEEATVREPIIDSMESKNKCGAKAAKIISKCDDYDTRSLEVGSTTLQDLNIGEKGTIDVGSGATYRTANRSGGYTYVDMANPANGTGILDTFEIWVGSNSDGVKGGVFSGSGTSYDDRDYETIGTVTAGAKRTFSGLNIDVVTGDYAGVYKASVRSDTDGGSDVYRSAYGDQFGKGAQTYTLRAGDAISLYGTGTEAGGDPDISMVPTSKDYGTVSESSTYWSSGSEPSWNLTSGDCFFNITNSGAACSVTVNATNFTGGNGWTLTSGSPGSGEVRLSMFVEGDGSGDGLALSTGAQELIASLAESGSKGLELKMETGIFTDGVEKSTIITFTAAAI